MKAIYIDPYVVSVCLGDVQRIVNDEIEEAEKESKEGGYITCAIGRLDNIARYIRLLKRRYEEKYLGCRVYEGIATYLEGVAQEIRPRMR